MDAWVVEVLREGYRILFSRRPPLSDQPLPMPFHQGKSLGAGVPGSPPQASHRTGSSDSRLLQSPICGPEGFRGLTPHHRPVYPEHLHRFPAISHGDSSVHPPFHSPRRLDDLLRSAGRIPPSSDPSRIASVSSLHHERNPLSVQGSVLRADNCPSGLYMADGSNIHHSPSLRYQDAQISRRLVDSRQIQDHLYPGEGQAPSSVRGAGITSQFQEVVLHPISGHDLSRHADPVSSIRCKTDRDKGSESPQDHRGVSFIPGPPSSSLASSSGPPFVPYSSGEGWDVADAISPDSPQVQVGLSRRVTSHPLGSSMSGGSFMVVLGDSTTRGRRSFSPGARLELLLGRVRRRLGCHRRENQMSEVWTPSQRELSINLREMMAVQKGLIEFSSLLRGKTIALFCDNVTTVAYLRRLGGTRSQVLFLKAREILLWVESMKITLLPQFIQGSLNTRADLLSRPNLVIGSEWTLHQEVVQDLLHQWPAIIDLFATSLTARLPVFFAPAWEPKAAGVDAFLQPWDNLQAYAFPPIAIIRRVLLKLRASRNCDLTLIAPFWPQREWFPDLLELLSEIPIELPKCRDLLRQPHFHRFHENLPMLRLTAWRLSSDSPVKQASLKQWLANLPSVGENLLD